MIARHKALVLTLTGPSFRRSLMVALVVGTALNAINQGGELLDGQRPVIWKLLLTYFVPFCVASYGSFAALCDSRVSTMTIDERGGLGPPAEAE